MDALILGLIPALLFALGGMWLIIHLHNQEEGERYQHEEYTADEHRSGGSTGNGHAGNGHGPPPG